MCMCPTTYNRTNRTEKKAQMALEGLYSLAAIHSGEAESVCVGVCVCVCVCDIKQISLLSLSILYRSLLARWLASSMRALFISA